MPQKAAIVEEFLNGLSPEQAEIIRATCSPDLKERPFGPIAGLIEDLLNVQVTDDLRAIRRQVESGLEQRLDQKDPEEQRYILHSVGLLLNVKYPENTVESLDSDRRRARIFLSLKRLFATLTRRGAGVMVVNDVQWADQSSLELLAEIIHDRHSRPTLVILTGRAQPDLLASVAWQRVVQGKNVVVETVKDLPPHAARALIMDLMTSPMDGRLVDQIVERSGGNPLFIKEILESLEDGGQLEIRDGVLSLKADMPDLEVPSTVEGIVAGRIGALPIDEKQVLLKLSHIGREIDMDQVRAVFEEIPQSSLDRLVERGFLSREDQGSDTVRLRFRQGLMQRVAAQSLMEEEQVQIHARLAAYMLDQQADLSEVDQAKVARHFEQAGQSEQSASYYLLAAKKAHNTSGLVEGLSLVDRSLAHAGDSSEVRFEGLDLKEQLLTHLGRSEERRQVLEELKEFVGSHGPATKEVRVLNRLARYEFDTGSMERAESALDRALELAEEYSDDQGRGAALTLKGAVLRNTGRERESWKVVRTALDLYETVEDPEGAAMAWNLLGILYHQAGMLAQALEAYETVAKLAEKAGLRSIEEMARINTGFCLVKMGDYERALDAYRRVLHEILQLGQRRNESALLANLGHVQVLLGDFVHAEHSLKRCIRLSREALDVMRAADGLLTLALSYLVRGRLEEANKVLRPGLKSAEEAGNKYLILHGYLLQSELKLKRRQAGDLEGALADAEHVLKTAEGSHHLFARSRAESIVGRCLTRMDREEEGYEASLRAVELLKGGVFEGAEEVLYHHALLAQQQGRVDEAVEAIGEAHRIYAEKRDRIQNTRTRRQFSGMRGNVQIAELYRELVGSGDR